MKRATTACALAALLLSAEGRAQDDGRDVVRHYLFAELSAGGDDLAAPDSGNSLRAGNLFQLAYSARFSNQRMPDWQADLRIGVKADLIDLGGGNGYFVRYPLEVALQRRVGSRLYLGFGLAMHLLPSYSLKVGAVDDSIDFDDAVGGFLHAHYALTERLALGVRYLSIEYGKGSATFRLPNGDTASAVDGSAVGAYLIYGFR